MKKIILSVSGLSLLAIGGSLVVTSCSQGVSSFGKNLKTQQFTSVVSKTTKTGTAKTNVVDAEINENAQQILKDKFSKAVFTVANLQSDFNNALSDFYEVYEIEGENIEIELESIKVNKEMEELSTNGNRQFELTVSYSVKTETKDKEVIQTKNVTWELIPAFINSNEIANIKEAILSATTNNQNVDLKDLKEFFLGEKDDDDKDDIGVFDKVSALNSQDGLNNTGVLIGYNIKLKDIWGALTPTLPKAIIINMDTVFAVPSLVINTLLKPTVPPTRSFELNETNISQVTKTEFSTTATLPSADPNFTKFFVTSETSILKTPFTNEEVSSIKEITIEEVGPFMKVTVVFNDTTKDNIQFGISLSLFKVEVVVPTNTSSSVL